MLTDEVRGPRHRPCEVPVRGTRPPPPPDRPPLDRAAGPRADVTPIAHPVRRLRPAERHGGRRT
ncbi:hypothetical protein [Nonomuraea sp. NPDC003214]